MANETADSPDTIAVRIENYLAENHEIVRDPETSGFVLGRFLEQLAELAVELEPELEEAADDAARAADVLKDAVENKKNSPARLAQLEKTYRQLKARYDYLDSLVGRMMKQRDLAYGPEGQRLSNVSEI